MTSVPGSSECVTAAEHTGELGELAPAGVRKSRFRTFLHKSVQCNQVGSLVGIFTSWEPQTPQNRVFSLPEAQVVNPHQGSTLPGWKQKHALGLKSKSTAS